MKIKTNVELGDIVSVPDRIIFPGRRDPYEYENGTVIAFRKNEKDEVLVKVRVWNSFTKKFYVRWFKKQAIYFPSFHHFVGEEEKFKAENRREEILTSLMSK